MDKQIYFASLKNEIKTKFCSIGISDQVSSICEIISTVAPTDAPVFISGESGTGKELIARAIHYNSNRSDKPFVTVNCASIPESLIEAELFGYEKGSFTSSVKDHKGFFHQADQGTIFLDEIGDLSLASQVKILRVIQEKEFNRIGSEKKIKVDFRIIAATNQNLPLMIKAGKFRSDLYFRLNVIPINIPPLRERKEDIHAIVEYFLYNFSQKYEKNITKLEKSALKKIEEHSWPGNVRELENTIERAVILAKTSVLKSNDIVFSDYYDIEYDQISSLNIAENEKILIKRALKKTNGNRKKAAEILGISLRALMYKIKNI